MQPIPTPTPGFAPSDRSVQGPGRRPAAADGGTPSDRPGRADLIRGRRLVLRATIVSALLAVIKVGAGILGNSFALLADGFESVLDLISGSVVWGGLRVAQRPPDANHP